MLVSVADVSFGLMVASFNRRPLAELGSERGRGLVLLVVYSSADTT